MKKIDGSLTAIMLNLYRPHDRINGRSEVAIAPGTHVKGARFPQKPCIISYFRTILFRKRNISVVFLILVFLPALQLKNVCCNAIFVF